MKVIAFGSPVRRDDGVGLAVLERLRARDLPPDAQLIEGGTGALALLEELAEGGGAPEDPLIIDAAEMGLEPGAVRVFDLSVGCASTDARGRPFSLHDADLNSALALARALGRELSVRIVGVQPADLAPGEGLSPAVAAAVEVAAEAALKEIRSRAARRRGVARTGAVGAQQRRKEASERRHPSRQGA